MAISNIILESQHILFVHGCLYNNIMNLKLIWVNKRLLIGYIYGQGIHDIGKVEITYLIKCEALLYSSEISIECHLTRHR